MAGNGTIDSTVDAALKSLADIVVPQPVSYVPQTWGWVALAALLLLVIAAFGWLQWRRWRANRYRREALAELERLEDHLSVAINQTGVQQKLAEIIKRTALAAWPREAVANLSGAPWALFIAEHGPKGAGAEALSRLVDDREYAGPALPLEEQMALIAATRQWIEKHHVSA